jgi:hypothetical protein
VGCILQRWHLKLEIQKPQDLHLLPLSIALLLVALWKSGAFN